MFGRYGFRNLTTDRRAEHPAAVGRRRQRPHLLEEPPARARARRGCRQRARCSRCASAIPGPRPARTRRRSAADSALDQFGLPGLPSDARIAGGLPTQIITGFSDLGRQATNPQWQYPTVYNPKINYTWTMKAHSFKSGYEFQKIDTEVQDVNPLYGRDTYNGQFSRPAGAAANNVYNLADFMLGLRAQYALSSVLVAELRRNMQFAYVQDDWRAASKLTLNLGLRYEYSTPYWETQQRAVELRSGDQPHAAGDRTDRSPIAR